MEGNDVNEQTKQATNVGQKSERDFSLVVAVSSALGMGTMLAVSQALRFSKPSISFDFSIWTAVAFLAGFNVTFIYVRRLFRFGDRAPRGFRLGGMALLVVLFGAALLYPLRFLGLKELVERLAGVLIALCFITTGELLVRRMVTAAECEEERQEAGEHRTGSANPALQSTPEGERNQ
jgi:hypothetical protein